MKKAISFALVLMLVFSFAGSVGAEPVRANDETTASQLNLLYSNLNAVEQDETAATWCYTVTDLDHNGRLEIVAASIQGGGSNTVVKIWEVNEEQTDIVLSQINVPEGQSFPDIIVDNVDTYYNAETDTWAYIFYDNMTLNVNDVYSFKCSVTFQNGAASFTNLATQHTQVVNGFQTTSYIDSNGVTISPEQYNAAGINAYTNMLRSSTSFDWFLVSDAADAIRLADSYAVFKGVKELPKAAENPVPVTVTVPSQTPATSSTVNNAVDYLIITKNPTSESKYAGDSALFIAGASTWTSLSWTFVSPDGGQFSVQSFRNMFPGAVISGEYNTSFTVSNLTTGMSGWGVYCTFYFNSQTARTSTAYMYVVTKAPTATPRPTTSPSVIITPGYYSVYQGNGAYTQYYEDGSYTTYYSDGSSYTNYGNGTTEINNGDGSGTFYYGDGSGTNYGNGYWENFASDGSVIRGGVDYDYYPEIYSDVYGWGYLTFHCANCGNEIPVDVEYCPYCGYHYNY